MIHKHLHELIGGTPMLGLSGLSSELGVDVYAKLESFNPTGSIKDRPAATIIQKALEEKRVDRDSLIIESSSGNFGVAVAGVCRRLGMPFVCVVDPNTTQIHRFMMEQLGARVELVEEPDGAGGYLANRLRRVRRLLEEHPNAYWTNQYANQYNWMAHYYGTAREMYEQMDGRIDYLFAAVSSGGTITGCARYLKQRIRSLTVVAVDVVGSAIFGQPPQPRYIPGVGSSRVPKILDRSVIDAVVHVPEPDTIRECHRLLSEEGLFMGGSSGTACSAVRLFFAGRDVQDADPPRVAVVLPDRGERYFQSLYDPAWVAQHYPQPTDVPVLVAVGGE
jgi:cysteine synthase A